MSKEKKPQDAVKFLLGLILLVLAWNTWEILQMRTVTARVDQYNRGVIDEVGKVTGNVKSFGEDLNDIRRFLLLPEKNYFDEEQTDTLPTTEEQETSENSQAVFVLLDSLVKENTIQKNSGLARPVFDALIVNADFQTKIAAAQLKYGEKGDLQVKFVDTEKMSGETQQNVLLNQPLYNLIFVPQENAFKVQSALGEETFKDYSSADFTSKLADYLTKNAVAVRDKKIIDMKTSDEDARKIQQSTEAQLSAKKKELEDIVKDKAFTETLTSIGLKVADKPREETNKYIFDIVDGSGKVRLSLALEISSGMIKVIRDNQETDINNFLQTEGSKKKL